MSRTITISPVTRIEGHARISIQLDDTGQVAEARLQVGEFRGFEAFCIGRPFWEMPAMDRTISDIARWHIRGDRLTEGLLNRV